jgi:hypothetical protein
MTGVDTRYRKLENAVLSLKKIKRPQSLAHFAIRRKRHIHSLFKPDVPSASADPLSAVETNRQLGIITQGGQQGRRCMVALGPAYTGQVEMLIHIRLNKDFAMLINDLPRLTVPPQSDRLPGLRDDSDLIWPQALDADAADGIELLNTSLNSRRIGGKHALAGFQHRSIPGALLEKRIKTDHNDLVDREAGGSHHRIKSRVHADANRSQ